MINKYKQFDLNSLEKYKLKEGWFSFATLLLAFVVVVSSVVSGQWQPGINLLTTTGIVAFLLGFVLARIRFVPAILAHSFMISVGMVFIGFQVFPYTDPQYTSWSEKLGSTVLAVVKWVQNAVAGHEHDDGLVFLVSLAFLVWLLGYASVWLIFRSHRPWWTLAILGTTLFINLSYNPPGAVRAFAIFLLASLLLVIRMNVFLNEERWRRSRLFFRPGLWRSAMAVGGVLTLLVTLLAFGLPVNDNVNPIKSVMDKFSGPLGSVQGGLNSFFVAPNGDKARRDPLSSNNFNSFDNSFTLGGPFKQNPDPILKVSGADPTYLQSNVFDFYDGKHWVNTYQSAPGITSTDIVFPPLALGPNQDLPTSNDKGRQINQITVTQLEPTGFSMFVGGDLKNTSLPAVLRYHYEPIVIENVPLEAFQKVNGILVDTTNNNKPVPPTLLPLLTNLYTAYKSMPPTVKVTYTRQGGNWKVSFSSPGLSNNSRQATNAKLTSDGYYNAQIGDWNITLPTISSVQELGTKVKSGNAVVITADSPNSYLSAPAFQANNSSLNLNSRLSTVTAYHALDNSWTFTYDPSSNGEVGASAKQKFETTNLGQAIKTQIADLERQNQGMHIDYTVQNNQPINLTAHGYTPNYDDLTGVSSQQVVQPGQSYTTNSLRYSFDEQSLRQAGTEYPDWVKERYLQMPLISPEIQNLAQQLTAGLTNPFDKAKAIEAFLRSDRFTYNTDVAYPPANRDFLDYFLFDTREGYCTYFSTAMDVLLRSVGIPSREVEGFLGGDSNGDGTYTIKGTAAHAWTQVYFPGYGWVRFEPTPGRGSVNNLPVDGSAIQPTPVPTPGAGGTNPTDVFPNDNSNSASDPLKVKGRSDPENSANNADGSNSANGGPPLWLLLSGLVIFGAFGLVGLNKLWIRSQMRLPVTTPAVVYTRMLKTARQARLEPLNGMTQYEYANYLANKLPEAAGAINFITDRYVKNRYSLETQLEQKEQMPEPSVAEENTPENYLDSNKVWNRLRIQGEKHQAVVIVQDNWEALQIALIHYRRQRLVERIIPPFLYKMLVQTGSKKPILGNE